ncbi:hypothetical protein IHE44_0005702 [Lamprotornis superbus]|uniref:Myeloid leukemia factor 2 n=2 Tax=Passeriformes TaxID=9126 RepID=A0A835NNR4_9PASS|nr:hypothetical protein IHE44_0005702 [Lamprotornis superbus]
MFRLMRDGEPEDPMFAMDPFAIHRQHMNRMLSGSFGFGPLLGITDGTTPGARQAGRRMQAGAVSPFGMLGMAGGFIDMFGMMNDMIGNMEHMTSGANCQTFTSSTVISYSNLGDGPKVYQETSEMRSAPGGIRETRRTVRDSDSGLEQMSIGHHIRERAHIMQRSRNHRTGDQEERQDYINMDESDAAAFDDEWRRETSRFRTQRGLEYRRHEGSTGRRAEGTRLAIQGPEDSPSRQSRRGRACHQQRKETIVQPSSTLDQEGCSWKTAEDERKTPKRCGTSRENRPPLTPEVPQHRAVKDGENLTEVLQGICLAVTLLPTHQVQIGTAAEAKLLTAAAQHLHHLQEGEQQAPQKKLCRKSAIITIINSSTWLPLGTGQLEAAGKILPKV